MPKPVHKVKLDKRVRVNRDAWDAETKRLHAEFRAEEALLGQALHDAHEANPGTAIRLPEQALRRARELAEQIKAREKETRRRLAAVQKERNEAKFRIHQLGNCQLTIAALEKRLAKGDDVADRLAEQRARIPQHTARVEEIEEAIDAAFLPVPPVGNAGGKE